MNEAPGVGGVYAAMLIVEEQQNTFYPTHMPHEIRQRETGSGDRNIRVVVSLLKIENLWYCN